MPLLKQTPLIDPQLPEPAEPEPPPTVVADTDPSPDGVGDEGPVALLSVELVLEPVVGVLEDPAGGELDVDASELLELPPILTGLS